MKDRRSTDENINDDEAVDNDQGRYADEETYTDGNWDLVRSELEQRFRGSRGQSSVIAEIAAINSRAAQQIFFGDEVSTGERGLRGIGGTRALGQGARLRAELRADDNGYFRINESLVVTVGLDEPRTFQRDLSDGDYVIRYEVFNSGAWAWLARIRLVVNAETLADVYETGGSGPFYTGRVWDGEWRFRIVGGELREF
jgi:hypothetical protein